METTAHIIMAVCWFIAGRSYGAWKADRWDCSVALRIARNMVSISEHRKFVGDDMTIECGWHVDTPTGNYEIIVRQEGA